MNERRDLTPIGESVDAFLDRIGMPTAVDLEQLVGEWDNVAGEPFAKAAEPIGFRQGELILGVPDGVTATTLKYRLGTLLDRLQAHFGESTVTAIKIRVTKPKKGP